MTIGERLKQIRGSRTLEEFAEPLEISSQQIWRIENDKSGMSLELAVKISKVYKCSLDWLSMGIETNKNTSEESTIDYVPMSKHLDILEKYNKLLEDRVEKQEEKIREQQLQK